MGLSIRPGGAQWSYGGFNRFRKRLAEAEGFDLEEMVGFSKDGVRGTKPWSDVRTFLAPLLNHSDCEGHLDSWECEDVVSRLSQIIATWDTDDYDRKQAELLLDGMRHSIQHGCSLAFE